jgi:hypothetical protein
MTGRPSTDFRKSDGVLFEGAPAPAAAPLPRDMEKRRGGDLRRRRREDLASSREPVGSESRLKELIEQRHMMREM